MRYFPVIIIFLVMIPLHASDESEQFDMAKYFDQLPQIMKYF